MVKNDFIYLDHAAATPVDPRVFEAMKPFFLEKFFNPSAPYLPGKRVREIYENAKDELAHTIGAKGNDLVITAGATESINLAFTVLKNYKNANCLISKIEHASVREAAKNFAKEVREINVDKNGLVDLKDLEKKIDDKTVLISVAVANNELGTIEPLSEISEIIKKVRVERLSRNIETPLYLHSDASQAMSLIDIYISRLGVDLLTINSAKVYGPKGIGALYVAHGIKLSPITFGGGQEMGLRSGTENVPLLVGFSTAAKIAKEHVNGNRKKFEKLNKIFKETLVKELYERIEVKFLGNPKKQLSNFIPICFDGFDAERLIFKLENEKVYLSTGAACAASKGEKSHVLKAIGLTDSEIAGSLRISLGTTNNEEQMKLAAKKIAKTVLNTLPKETVSKKNVVKTVFVGMSGGVDSSVSALLLKEQGYHVVGVYMKNWSKDLPGMKCPWAEDLADAKRVATKLGIDFMIFDFENEYKQKVVNYMLDEFKKGNTPNPDIMCNQEIKFKLFYDIAREKGADFIATGHYAKTDNDKLLKATDENKDQTYFLYRIEKDAIAHTIFPIGDMLKPDVKKLAAKKGLDNAYKKESMGVCFVGDVGMKDFLKEYLKSTEDRKKFLKPGKIIDRETKEAVGFHDGAIFYTIGQRHGLNVGGGLPYYVVGKDMKKNEVYVSKNLNDENLWTKTLELKDVILREKPTENMEVEVRLRHRAKLEKAILKNIKGNFENGTATLTLEFENEIKRTASGQSAVIYKNEICLGGGILK
ncbi:tRNA 2-thiouridine(34) synthase MnmA [Candidatus Saccharibacteria bacterium]|nr:tRNA 2-thiouridine(34) synthase MnmA [Candidatus Saccharibacteria bacterium]